MKKALLGAMLLAFSGSASAQLSTNPDKFLGNITTRYSVDYNGFQFYKYWNQLTCENESKWGSVEGTNGNFNWPTNQINYAKQHKFPFKWHALIWGAQHPSWFNSSMKPEQRYKEIVQWMDAIKKQYPNLELIDVANECISGHQADTYLFAEALGGGGVTGWDWLIKAFEMAHERWPNAILIYNDFNTFQWNTDQFIEICKTLRDAGAPIDAYGCQSHDLNGFDVNSFKNVMKKLQDALKMPMYITEYDIGTTDDNRQLKYYKEQIPVMWEADYCAGITLWGWHYGCTWTHDTDANGKEINNGHSGIINTNKSERPAMTWLKEYMASDKAKNAKSPFPGMTKEASVYIKPSSINIEKNKENSITVYARMKSKVIDKVELYAGNTLITTMTEGADGKYVASYTPTTTGAKELKAVVTTTDGFTWTRYSTINVCNPRAPYKNTIVKIPGKVQFENFDTGADGLAFHDNNSQKQGDATTYRSDTGGIDVINISGGYGVGWTEVGEWMEYTINVTEAGLYSYDINYSAPEDGAAIYLATSTENGLKYLTSEKQILAKTGGWSTYKTAHGRMLIPLEEGEQRIRFGISGGSGQYVINLDHITFTRTDVNENIMLSLSSDPKTSSVSTKTTVAASVQSEDEIKNVKIYQDGVLKKTATTSPYEYVFTPTAKGDYAFTAIATDADGKESKIASYTLKVTAKRTPFKGVISIPGTIEAENFDKGEEGFTYHDSDSKDEGDAKYRTDSQGVDIVKGNGGNALGYIAVGEWTEYSVNVKEAGQYNCTATVSSGTSGGGKFTVGRVNNGKATTLWTITVPNTANWDTYRQVNNTNKVTLDEGEQIIRFTITSGGCNIDKVELKCVVASDIVSVSELSVCTYDIFTASGTKLGQMKANGSVELKQKIYEHTGKKGMYIVKNTAGGNAVKIMVK